MATLLLFVALQFCDAVTTLVFLRHGIAEANPIVRFALGFSATPALPLLALKGVGCALAIAAWRLHRLRLLHRINCFFAICVAWNLVALAVRA
jgi:hypothetical protein